jgi:ribosome maturation factor RimP
MSGSSRHGSVRPPAAAGSRPGTGGRSGAGGRRGSGGRPGRSGTSGESRAGGRSGPDSRPGAGAVDAEKIAELLAPVLSAAGLDLEGVRVTAAGRRRLLRLTVDADGGVSLDDIALVSRDLSAALDDSSVMGELPYTLEVSSPGVDRPLTDRRHWRRAIGRLVTAPLQSASGPANGGSSRAGRAATVEGRIIGASADAITLEIDGESRQFGYGDLGPGKIKIEFAPIDAGADDDLDGAGPDAGEPGRSDRGDAGTGDDGADEEGPGGY